MEPGSKQSDASFQWHAVGSRELAANALDGKCMWRNGRSLATDAQSAVTGLNPKHVEGWALQTQIVQGMMVSSNEG